MFQRFINFIKGLLGFDTSSVKDPSTTTITTTSTTPQTASVEIVKKNLTNEILFHKKPYNPPLTVNALVHGGTLKQRDFMRNAINVLRHVVVSDLFQSMVLDHGPFSYTEDNPLEVYTKFLSGKDLYEQFEDKEMDVDMTLYRSRLPWKHKVIGYTYPSTRKTWINMRHFDIEEYETMAKVVGNIVHEYMHNIGYKHPSRKTKTRHLSVPYAYGYMARDLALEFLGSGRDIPKYSDLTKGKNGSSN